MASCSAGAGSKPVGPEITAEWTVHAQLTLSHQGASGASAELCSPKDPSSKLVESAGKVDDSVPASSNNSQQKQQQPPPPVKVVYKFSTADSSLGNLGGIVTTGSNNLATPAGVPIGGRSVEFKQKGDTIFNSNDSTSGQPINSSCEEKPDSKPGFEDSNLSAIIAAQAFPKCTSTCSIVLTADLLPVLSGGGEALVSVGKCSGLSTVDKYTCFPEKSMPTDARDVSCQTSDIEMSLQKAVQTSQQDLRSQQKKAAEALLSPIMSRRDDKYGSIRPKSPISPTAVSPTNTLQSQHSSVKDDKKKKPRTVHIDVYCTGSDAESSSSDESSVRSGSGSSSSSGSRFDTSHRTELKSSANVTHPTIYESEEMKLRHKRAAKHEVPRRLMQHNTVDQSTLSTVGSLKRAESHSRKPVKRSNTKEEIHESKQMLLNKILGDQNETDRFPSLEYLRRATSDDNISSNYAFSMLSTRRDITGSSLSSALAELDESAIKPTTSGTIVAHSDSFEYENSEDRYRIHQMERLWGKKTWKSPSAERKLLEIHNPKRRQISESDNNLSESDHSFVFDGSGPRPVESIHSLNEFSDSSPSTVKSCSNRAPSNAADSSKRILHKALLNVSNSATFPLRSWSPIDGYSSEYQALARRFGSLITGKRKPGVHMGPVRNPECQCEHCRRWMLERDGGGPRDRALSVAVEFPANIIDMRKQYHLRNRKIS
ncbi:uncharacterized protein LOC131435673 [Malaya genurostris]|uniref:uncharacterized protein LOC131435673 n=1 Tax=Malaya genurostris TaxID=325434 RepID=UPI0026F3D9A3|nr:uncharacterized protein LOC131435673 [Malaya genurostris]XP_058459796.1 uncharacterized protein LOC131435673 [Malaya genurostris]XP_058459797.1 uncharacterized protein LOC131435673 [Malaya genurostris]XP_058459798.1 uncharacterized protein LOC131435673 [Malaya genurostris]XP_058459799.1 uncharacterized protein LOC131435673 [Malaya genurostris]